ncbi:MAG: hypothetical protein VX185_04815 [Pseudomonadota bacterium]|nr:hypothetical protein [Pseudomonadota bacterium]
MKFYRDPETQKVKLTTSQKIKCSFFMFVMFLSALGAFGYGVLPFSPFPITRGYATAAGFISFLFYAFVVFWFVVENLPHKSKLYKTLHICGG